MEVNAEVLERFHGMKSKFGMEEESDSSFLLFMIDHIENCHLTANRQSALGVQENGSDYLPSNELKPHICPECKYSTHSSDDLRSHFESAHSETGSFSCTCGVSYRCLAEFLQHYIECPIAATDLADPTSQHSGRSPNSDRMMVKESQDNGSPNVLYHSYHHPFVSPVPGPSKDKPFGCPKCSKAFKSKSLLDQHMHLHYPPRYKCRWCSKVYRWPPAYYHHKQKCNKRPVFHGIEGVPSNCTREKHFHKSAVPDVADNNLALAQKALANFMNLNVLALPKITNDSAMPPVLPVDGQFPTCQPTCICNEKFSSLSSYFDHIKTCDCVLSTSSSLNGGSLPTQVIDNSLPSSSQCLDIAEPSDLSTSNESSLYNMTVTAGIFSCTICGKDFNSKLSLKQHVDGKHRAEGKYLCPACGKRYRWGASFYYHKKTCLPTVVTDTLGTQSSELLATNS